MRFSLRLVLSSCTYLISTKVFTVHSFFILVSNKMHFLEAFKQIAFPKIAFAANPYTNLYKVRKGKMVVDAIKVASILTLGLNSIAIRLTKAMQSPNQRIYSTLG